jgi:antitoxin component YwqK of YwqJK toxin-antitoxin module
MAEYFYKNGKREGVAKRFLREGGPESTYTYQDDKLNGPYVIYGENGIVAEQGNYRDDKLQDVFKPSR